ncbi:MAG: BMP family ABC transporter substrate-binding protein [Chloroflexi bacterium]|nr:BMP family ABC transporter substrate-binding protein [Chloroflexota bacterium]
MSKKVFSVLSMLIVAAFLFSACAPTATEVPTTVAPPTEAPATEAPATEAVVTEAPATEAPSYLVCQVSDTGGIDDKSFNATAWKGVTDAEDQLGVVGKFLESTDASDYEKNINAFIDDGCNLIITVGYALADNTKAAAEANPDQLFSIVDYNYGTDVAATIPNVWAQSYQTDQAAFLVGYLAAGVTKTGVVGTFGGANYSTVSIFMDGFARGVAYYNEKHTTTVKVLGWDTATQTGTFTDDFVDLSKAKTVAENMMDEGADIIMPVGGSIGLGAAEAITERTTAEAPIYLIGVDSDWYNFASDYQAIILTSVMKNMDSVTTSIIKSAMEGTFTGGLYVGNLENNGVAMAPFHDLDSVVSDALKAELETVKADLLSGAITLNPAYIQ